MVPPGCCVIPSIPVPMFTARRRSRELKRPSCLTVVGSLFTDFITPAGPLLARERTFMRENAINLLSLKDIRHHVACS